MFSEEFRPLYITYKVRCTKYAVLVYVLDKAPDVMTISGGPVRGWPGLAGEGRNVLDEGADLFLANHGCRRDMEIVPTARRRLTEPQVSVYCPP